MSKLKTITLPAENPNLLELSTSLRVVFCTATKFPIRHFEPTISQIGQILQQKFYNAHN